MALQIAERRGRNGWPDTLGRFLIASLIWSVAPTNPAFGASKDADKAEAARLVAGATQAEIHGDNAQSFSLLHKAVQLDPDNRLARWQLGEVQVDKEWVSVEEAQRRASTDPRQ